MPSFPVKMRLAAVDKMSKVLKKVTSSLKGVNRATRQVNNRFRLMQMRTKKIRESLGKVGSNLKSFGAGLTAKVTAPIAAMGIGIIRTAANFESAFNEVIAKTKVTSVSLEQLREQAKLMGSESVFSATEAAKAQAFLAKAGFKTHEIYESLPAVLDLAAASQLDLATASDITSNIMGAFEIESKDSTKVANVLARATAGANVDMEQLGETFKKVGPIAKAFGANIDDAAAAAGLLGNIGIQGSEAGTALKAAFLGLSAPSSKAAKLLKSMGIEVFDKTKNKMFGFAEIMKRLGGRLKDLPKDAQLKVLKEVFGKLSISGGAALAKFAEAGKLDDFVKQLNDVNVTAKGMAATMNKGAKGGMKAFMSALEGLAIAIGDSGVLEMFTKLLMGEGEDGEGGLVGFIRGVSRAAKANPMITKIAVALGLFAAAIGPIVLALGAFLTILPSMITGVGLLTAAFTPLTIKIILIGALIGALVLAGWLLVKNWDKVKAFIFKTWESISAFMDTKTGKIVTILGLFVAPFITIPALIIKHWEPIKAFFSDLWGGVVKSFEWAMKKLENGTNKAKKFFGIDVAKPVVSEKVQARIDKLNAKNNAINTPEKTAITPENGKKQKSEVTVDFKNMPKGVSVQTKSTDKDVFNINTGLQGAAI